MYIVRNEAGEMGYKIMVGGGLGRTPIIGSVIREFLPREDLIAYLEAILRVITYMAVVITSIRRVSKSWLKH